MGFKGQNEYELHLKEEIADWLLLQIKRIKSTCADCKKEFHKSERCAICETNAALSKTLFYNS